MEKGARMVVGRQIANEAGVPRRELGRLFGKGDTGRIHDGQVIPKDLQHLDSSDSVGMGPTHFILPSDVV